MDVELAPDVQAIMEDLVFKLDLKHVDSTRIVCMRSRGTKNNAIARIWSMPDIWQKALKIQAHYVIEVISTRFDRLSFEDKQKTILHELLHVPKTFSGALVPHKCFGKMRVNETAVNALYKEYKRRIGDFVECKDGVIEMF
ncbi:MAG: metallopeptidase [Candidatus Diapherotrites archaeon]|nr:metallopeptidase [Candidatus Diapherotrites archaeon]